MHFLEKNITDQSLIQAEYVKNFNVIIEQTQTRIKNPVLLNQLQLDLEEVRNRKVTSSSSSDEKKNIDPVKNMGRLKYKNKLLEKREQNIPTGPLHGSAAAQHAANQILILDQIDDREIILGDANREIKFEKPQKEHFLKNVKNDQLNLRIQQQQQQHHQQQQQNHQQQQQQQQQQ